MGRKQSTDREEESLESSKQGGGSGGGEKSKKKNLVIDDDEYSVGMESSNETMVQDDKVAESSKKIGKKGKKFRDRDDDGEGKRVLREEDDEQNKSKEKSVVIDDDDYSIETEISDKPRVQEEEVAPSLAFGKKKGTTKKWKKVGGITSSYAVLGENNDDEDRPGLSRNSGQEVESVASVTGKVKNLKRGNSSASLFTTSVFHTIDDEDKKAGQLSKDDEEPAISFIGKVHGISLSAALLDEENDADAEAMEEDDIPEIIFSGKKKSSTKKNNNAFSRTDTDVGNDSADVVDQDQASIWVNRVREMQERPKKMKEAEERKKKEEEERLRKEEEERLRLEEQERLVEEKKRLKKEREKENLLKKRQVGNCLLESERKKLED